MSARSSALGVPILMALGITGCGPLLVFPAGELDGDVAPAPQDWDFTAEIRTVQLETRPSKPYSVNIWATSVGDVLYIHAGENRARWVEHIEANPDVRIRIESRVYLLRAQRVDTPAEFARFVKAYERKYGSPPRNRDVTEAYLFRLTPR